MGMWDEMTIDELQGKGAYDETRFDGAFIAQHAQRAQGKACAACSGDERVRRVADEHVHRHSHELARYQTKVRVGAATMQRSARGARVDVALQQRPPIAAFLRFLTDERARCHGDFLHAYDDDIGGWPIACEVTLYPGREVAGDGRAVHVVRGAGDV
jgi:hypothetical protein